ncbi:MAG: rhomboid family intramembrane serine protease [Chloroflexi bacterium]|nr:rhomboid family intramembrane serine protease [Chloroflexota bacterium]
MYYYRQPSARVVWYLIGINALVFFITLPLPGLVFSLGLSPFTFDARPWTIISSMFVHAGFGHILGNMFTLYFFGSYLLGLVGTRLFLITYLVGGLLGNIFLLLLAPLFPFTVAVGASGAVFAVGGALSVLRPKLRVYIFPIPAPIPLWIAVVGGFFILSLLPFVAWQAHLGGLLLGLGMGYKFRRDRY